MSTPVTGNTIVATAAAMATCSSPADYTDSLTSTCSESVCVAMPCGGGSFHIAATCDSVAGTGGWNAFPTRARRRRVVLNPSATVSTQMSVIQLSQLGVVIAGGLSKFEAVREISRRVSIRG